MRFLLFLCLFLQDDPGKRMKDSLDTLVLQMKSVKTSGEARALAEEMCALAEQAYKEDCFEVAMKSLEHADKLSRGGRDPSWTAKIQGRLKECVETKKEYEKTKEARDVLSLNPNDPEANTMLGKFYVLQKGDFDVGLLFLSRGVDPLSKVSALDLTKPSSAPDQMALGDQWWNFKPHSIRMKERAIYWYSLAWPSLQGLGKEKLRTRLRETRQGKFQARMPDGWHDMPGHQNPKGIGIDMSLFHAGRASLRVAPDTFLRYGPFPVRPGQKVGISVWMCSDGSEGLEDAVRVRIFTAQSGLTHFGPSIPKDSPFWTFGEASMVMGDTVDHADIVVRFASKSGNAWIDDLVVTVDGTPILKASFESDVK